MTRDEAIKNLEEIIDEGWLISDLDKCTAIDACEMAIKALEQEPCEDAVSLEAVIEWLKSKDIIKLSSQADTARKELKTLSSGKLQPSGDVISRQALITSLQGHRNFFVNSYGTYKHMAPKDKVRIDEIDNCIARIVNAPSVTPQYTDAEIQKMQKLEQAEIEKAYELGKAEMQPSEDAISRQNTLAEFKRLYFDNDTVIRCAELVLGGMPSITPQTKKGHWIMHEKHRECSECKVWLLKDMPRNNYCPNCGAKMEVEI